MKKWLAVFAIAGLLVVMPSQAEAQVSGRMGLSHMTGVAGIEYQTGNISLGAGTIIVSHPISARYALNAEGNSLWAGLAFVINGAEVWEKNLSTKRVPVLGGLVGYRIDINERLDFSIGGGYGVYLGADADIGGNDTGGPLTDLSLGVSF